MRASRKVAKWGRRQQRRRRRRQNKANRSRSKRTSINHKLRVKQKATSQRSEHRTTWAGDMRHKKQDKQDEQDENAEQSLAEFKHDLCVSL